MTVESDDSLIRDYIRSATDYCEGQVTGSRAIVTQTWDWKLHFWPGGLFDIPKPPLQSVTHVKYYAEDSSTGLTTLSSTYYIVHVPTDITGSIELHPQRGDWPTIANRADALQVRFVAGYGTTSIPEQFKQAVKLTVGHYYNNREAVGNVPDKDLKMGVRNLLDSISYGDYS